MITFLIGVGLLLAFLVFCNRIVSRGATVDATIVWKSSPSVLESIDRAILATEQALPMDGKPHRVLITAGEGVVAHLDGEEIYREAGPVEEELLGQMRRRVAAREAR